MEHWSTTRRQADRTGTQPRFTSMATPSHFARLRASRWEALAGSAIVAAIVVLFAGSYVVQAEDRHPADALEVLYVLPVALLAMRFGLRGGLAGACIAIGLIAIYNVTAEWDVTLLGNLCWAAMFLLLGGLLGRFVDRRRQAEARLSDYF